MEFLINLLAIDLSFFFFFLQIVCYVIYSISDEETGRNMELFSFFSAPRIIVDLFRGESLTGSNLFDPLFHTAERIVTESIDVDASTYPPLVVRHSPPFPFSSL